MAPHGLRSVSGDQGTRETTHHACKSKDQVELILKNSKPQFSSRMREKNLSF